METKANYVLIGAATVAGVIFIMMAALWLSTGDYRRGFQEYDIVFDEAVRGLAEGGEVRFNGIKVGEVQTLRIDPDNANRVIARVRISRDIPVKVDSEARLEPIGLTGVTLIQLTPGAPNARLLRGAFGGPTPRIRGRGSQIDVLVERSEDIAMRASEAMAAVRDLLTDENIARVTRILTDLEHVSNELAAERSVINQSADAAAAMTQAAGNISALAAQAQGDLADLDVVVRGLGQAADVAAGQTLPEITMAAEELRNAANSISRVADGLEENPSVLTPENPRSTVELAP